MIKINQTKRINEPEIRIEGEVYVKEPIRILETKVAKMPLKVLELKSVIDPVTKIEQVSVIKMNETECVNKLEISIDKENCMKEPINVESRSVNEPEIGIRRPVMKIEEAQCRKDSEIGGEESVKMPKTIYIQELEMDVNECIKEGQLDSYAGLYDDHVVTEDLLLGPEHSHQPDVALVVSDWALADADGCLQSAPDITDYGIKDCFVRIKRLTHHESFKKKLDRESQASVNHTNTKKHGCSEKENYITLGRVKNASVERRSKSDCDNFRLNSVNCKRKVDKVYMDKLPPMQCVIRLERINESLIKNRQYNRTKTESLNGQVISENREFCDICGETFELKSDLMEHVLIHIYMPMMEEKVDQQIDLNSRPDKPLLERVNKVELALKDCWVKLERVNYNASDNGRGQPAHQDPKNQETECKDKIFTVNSCDLCGEKFTQKLEFMKHIMNHIYMPTGQQELEYNCYYSTLDQSQNAAIESRKIVPSFECDVCGETYHRKGLLKRHILRHAIKLSKMTLLNSKVKAQKRFFICDICGKKCTQKVHLVTHMRIHTSEKPYLCEVCKQRFKYCNTFNYHKRTHIGEKPYCCQICSKRFMTQSNLKCHKLVHTGEKPYSCPKCHKRYTGRTALKNHILRHLETLYPCQICDKQFKRMYCLKIHLRIHEGSKPYYCRICYKRFRQLPSLRIHETTHSTERPYICEICKSTFKLASILKSHKRVHTGEKPYSCDICEKKFTRADTLFRHNLIHTGEKPYSCEICKKRFTQLAHLLAHKSVHSDVRPYSCDICKKKYKTLDYLKIHKTFHNEVTTYYKCETCLKQFKTWSALKIHKRIHSNVRPYSCEICLKRFKRPGHVKIHMRVHTGEKPFSCDICESKFTQSGAVNVHKQTVHSLIRYSCA